MKKEIQEIQKLGGEPVPNSDNEPLRQRFIKNHSPEERKWGTDFLRLNANISLFTNGIRIPPYIYEQLGFEHLKWHTLFADSLYRLILAKSTEQDNMTDINDSTAIIEISKAMKSEQEGPSLNIVGIHEEQKRIMALRYALTNKNQLMELNVSVAPEESPLCLDQSNAFSEIRNKLTVSIENDRIIESGGIIELISKRMKTIKKETEEAKRDGLALLCNTFPHEILAFHTMDGKLYPGINSHNSRPDKTLIDAYEKLGYIIREEKGLMIVGVNKNVKNLYKKEVPSWTINVPSFLSRD